MSPGPEGTLAQTERERQAFEKVDLARNPGRPRTLQVINTIFGNWTELRGDRLFHDDQAIVGGFAQMGSRWVMVVGHEKGTDSKSRVDHNFGMPHPEGYRKAQRLMHLAARFAVPVICFVDTPAAHAGVGAEERGQGWAIAESLRTMLELPTPIISVILSEGGSGGALALALADVVLSLEHAIYTVAPPETCAAILYRDAGQKARAAAALKPTVDWAHRLGVVDELIPEPAPGAHAHPLIVMSGIRGALVRHLDRLMAKSIPDLMAQRLLRYRNPAPGD